MKFSRIFSGAAYKGTKNYLKTQKVYEILRTVLLFAISLSLFAAGWITTKERTNLLTVVAVLGCLPASKSAVSAILFCRYKGLSEEAATQIEPHAQGLFALYDLVFTGPEKTFVVEHLVLCGKELCGYASERGFDRKAFENHLRPLLAADSHRDLNIKILLELPKYTEQLEHLKARMQAKDQDPAQDAETLTAVAETLKSVSL